jgi:HAD superfamily hydrolase (TIGR01484 family)
MPSLLAATHRSRLNLDNPTRCGNGIFVAAIRASAARCDPYAQSWWRFMSHRAGYGDNRCHSTAIARTPLMRYSKGVNFSSSRTRSLLSFDFDGTMHDPYRQPSVSPQLFALLTRLRLESQSLWGINTGRTLEFACEGLKEEKFPLMPDYLIACEREIYYPDGEGGWEPDAVWNVTCHRAIAELLEESDALMERIRRLVGEQTGAQWLDHRGEPASLVARTEEEMAWIAGQVERIVPVDSHLGWQRNSIYLRFGHKDYQKGSSLATVAKHFAIPAEHVFAIGDSYNDKEMLDRKVAGMIACPGNAIPEIIAHVRSQEGYLCQQTHSEGVIEALTHFLKP